jgi:hypothetical protein
MNPLPTHYTQCNSNEYSTHVLSKIQVRGNIVTNYTRVSHISRVWIYYVTNFPRLSQWRCPSLNLPKQKDCLQTLHRFLNRECERNLTLQHSAYHSCRFRQPAKIVRDTLLVLPSCVVTWLALGSVTLWETFPSNPQDQILWLQNAVVTSSTERKESEC